jgi:putative iron-regulated protein
MRFVLLFAAALSVPLAACSNGGGGTSGYGPVVTAYADGVLASYRASASSAKTMDAAIDAFLAAPTEATLAAARKAWLNARGDYGVTEAFRFYDGPIDDPDGGPEGLINAWPMDEKYIDYVEGEPNAGIVNAVADFPTIDADTLAALNEQGAETNIATGWHAIEFLLWGQDLSEAGPGDRPVTDYTTHPNAKRRGTYLRVVSDQLVANLDGLVAAWSPGADTYRAEFLALPAKDALAKIVKGAGELSRGELAGERMNVAYEARSQEDEHSCFSDNTTNDIVANAKGIAMVLTGSFPGATGPSVLGLVRARDAKLAGQLEADLDASLKAVAAIPAPFDALLAPDVSDDDPKRASVLTAIRALEAQTDTIVKAASKLGLKIEVS